MVLDNQKCVKYPMMCIVAIWVDFIFSFVWMNERKANWWKITQLWIIVHWNFFLYGSVERRSQHTRQTDTFGPIFFWWIQSQFPLYIHTLIGWECGEKEKCETNKCVGRSFVEMIRTKVKKRHIHNIQNFWQE